MTLPASGTISISQISTELGRASTATTSLGETASRTLAGVSSGAISMSNFYGKSNFTPGFTGLAGTTFTVLWSTVNTYPVINSLYINTNGTWDQRDNNGAQISGTWGSPSVSGIGSNYWVKFTLNSVSGSTGSATATTGWQQLNAARNVDLLKLNGGTVTYSGNYTVQIATDSGGSNIVATASNFILVSSRA